MAAIFISHSSVDRPEAEELASWLQGQGIDSYFLDFDPDKGLTAGIRWEDELYRRLHSSFREEDAAVFFGRDAETQAVLERLDALRKPGRPKVVLLIGASGSGKSSLMRAGVLARLARQARSGDWLPLATFEPGADPLGELAKRLARAFADVGENRDRRALAAQRSAANLLELADDLRFASKKEDATVILAIDQAEQLLTSADASSRDFLCLLAELSRLGDRRLMVLATLRSDFLSLFQTSRDLEGLVYETLPVAPMQQRVLPLIIEAPAKQGGIRIEPGLVQLMVQDSVSGEALPLLAFTLRQMYDRYARACGALRIPDYLEMGGVEGAVRTVAERALADANPDDRQLAALRKAFVPGLVDITESGKYTGARARWEELPADAHPTLAEFIGARLWRRRVRSWQPGAPTSPAGSPISSHARRPRRPTSSRK
jgi:AAA ATPase domain/TIR domain